MTEQEWLTSSDPQEMLNDLLPTRSGDSSPIQMEGGRGGISDRKLRLWCYAWREAAEYWNKEHDDENVDPPTVISFRGNAAAWAVSLAGLTDTVPAAKQADLLRHIVGNPWRPMKPPQEWMYCGATEQTRHEKHVLPPGGITMLASNLYDGADYSYMLHDALLEAGQEELARHFAEASHPRGCWALDLILGKE